MLRLIGRRLLVSIPLLFVVSFLTFGLISLLPGSPSVTILGPTASQQQYQQLDQQLGLNRPLWTQYTSWLARAVRGDFGDSLITGDPVHKVLTDRLPVTLSLIAGATLLAALLGVGLGIAGAVRRGRRADAVNVISLAGSAIPNFWLALVLVATFSVSLRWLPATGYTSLAAGPWPWARSLLLPWLALGLGGTAVIAKQTRDGFAEAMSMDFIRVLRANGLSERSIRYRHALRNAAIGIVTTIGMVFVGLLSGSVLIETVFAAPGLGSATVTATSEHDLPVIQGAVVYFTLLVVVMNLLVDLSYGWLNPRVRR
ncbi:MAG: ABC transporter permease [Jatrophihabitantaceae bacterium]